MKKQKTDQTIHIIEKALQNMSEHVFNTSVTSCNIGCEMQKIKTACNHLRELLDIERTRK